MTGSSGDPSHGRALDAACRECGDALSYNPWESRPVRCEACFETYLREIDHDFLQSYAELGVMSRRTVAETCLRSLVLEMPPQRKVLAMAIAEQFLLASSDLIGLTRAIRNRGHESIVRSFLSFHLDDETSAEFFSELEDFSDEELLGAFGLPSPEHAERRYAALGRAQARELSTAVGSLLRDLRATGARGSSAALLSELAGQVRGGPALTGRSLRADENGLRPDQVASLVLDERRRSLVLQAVSVDEHQLGTIVDAIDCMTRAASNLIYAYLTVQDEEARLSETREQR
jgi:hypothetical protein